MKYSYLICLLLLVPSFFAAGGETSERAPARYSKGKVFKHPGISYTQGDFDRMKAMVESGKEPWKRCFEALRASRWASPEVFARNRGEGLGSFNNTIGFDGRHAHDQALMYRLTGDKGYADRARDLVNSSVNYRNVWATGTPPLDNGKIFLLVEAAEMIRDYPGWEEADKEKFRKVLREVFYPVICNGDRARWGNQGLSAFKGALAIGIFLDDEIIYDRVWNYLTDRPKRKDDPFPSLNGGARIAGWPADFGPYCISRKSHLAYGNEQDWGYDELLKYYIYRNGQCEESCRDQAHTTYGLFNYVAIAEMFWNQGDDLYSELDNRILLGLEWSLRYNLDTSWEPSGATNDENVVTFDNGLFYQANTRSGRWTAVNVSPWGRGADGGPGAPKTCALEHYKTRMGLQPEKMKWLQLAVDRQHADNGFESWGFGPNWFYEYCGWGTLTKTRSKWMRGDPGTWKNGIHISGAHKIPGSVKMTDWDYFPSSAGASRTAKHLRAGSWSTGDWALYTVTVEKDCSYDISLAYSSPAPAEIVVAGEGKDALSVILPKTSRTSKARLGLLKLPAGATVLRFAIRKCQTGFNPLAITID